MQWPKDWVRLWLLLNANSSIFQRRVIFQWVDDEAYFELDQHAVLDFYYKWNNFLRIDILPLSDILWWFRAFSFNFVCLAEKQQIPIVYNGLTRSGFEPTIYSTRDEHANDYTTDAVLAKIKWTKRQTMIYKTLRKQLNL